MTTRRGFRVSKAAFEPARGTGATMQITVVGENFVSRSAALMAKVGSEAVHSVILSLDGKSFVGLLDHAPKQGDALYVWYSGQSPQKTAVVYGASPNVA